MAILSLMTYIIKWLQNYYCHLFSILELTWYHLETFFKSICRNRHAISIKSQQELGTYLYLFPYSQLIDLIFGNLFSGMSIQEMYGQNESNFICFSIAVYPSSSI